MEIEANNAAPPDAIPRNDDDEVTDSLDVKMRMLNVSLAHAGNEETFLIF